MNKLFWPLIVLDGVLVVGLAILVIPFPGKGGSNVLDSLIGRVAVGLSILLVAVCLKYWNTRSPGIHLSLLILAAAPLVVGALYGVIFLRGPAKAGGLQSITSRLIGHHVNLSNALSRLAERGVLTASDLREILEADRAWFRERSRVEAQPAMDGRRPGADVKETEFLLRNQRHGNGGKFRGKQLTWANLTQSTAAEQDLFGVQMDGADFTGLRQPGFLGSYLREDGTVVMRSFTDLRMANLLGAEMRSSKLAEADMRSALLIGVDFTDANLRSTILWNADLRWVDFSGADLTGSEVDWADLRGANYEPAAGEHPKLSSFISAKNLSSMRWETSPAGLIELRESFKKAGLNQQERLVTVSLSRTAQARALKGSLPSRIEGILRLVLFDWTTEYGLHPWRALAILLGLIPLFSMVYLLALASHSRSGIWAVRRDNAVFRSKATKPVRMRSSSSRISRPAPVWWNLWGLKVAFYFSLLQAFRIGFREVNVGDWIERLQAKEYSLRATGWARTVGGIQSLVSVYLVAMWVLTLFGRPFE